MTTIQPVKPSYFTEKDDEFYNSIEAIRSTRLKSMMIGPEHYYLKKFSASPAMEFGTAVHTRLLEPHKFDYEERLDWRKTKQIPEAKTQKERAEKGLIKTLTPSDLKMIEKIEEGWLENEYAKQIKNADYEAVGVSLLGRNLVKCKCDAIFDNVIADIKTCSDIPVTESHVKGIINKYHYDLSAAFYIDIINSLKAMSVIDILIEEFWWFFIESKPPHKIVTVKTNLNSETIKQGREKYFYCYKKVVEINKTRENLLIEL